MTEVFNRFQAPRNHPRHICGESKAVGAAKNECDINRIVERMLAGNSPGVPIKEGRFMDATLVVDMKDNLDVITRHQSAYNELPEHIRATYKTPLEYYGAQQKAFAKTLRTSDSLDVSGPTDSNAVSQTPLRKEPSEAKTIKSKNGKKDVQASDGDEID